MTSNMRKDWKNKSAREKGFAVVITAISLFFLLPIVGLAIDASLLYSIKAKLQTSTDAAAIAAARTLSVGLTLDQQEGTARNQALTFFAANFPDGFANTMNQHVQVDIAETAFRTRTVTVTAQLDAPLYFMRTLWIAGLSNTHIAAAGKASRRDVNLVMVLDRSGSMARTPSGSSITACDGMKNAANYFVDQFAEGRDRLAMVTFNTGYYLAFAPSMTFKTGGSSSLPSKIDAIACTGGTATAGGLYEGYQLIRQINEPGALNLIVLFTDGIPNGVAAYYPVKKVSDTRYGYGADGYTSVTSTYSMSPSTCRDSANRQYGNSGWSPGDANGNLYGVVAMASVTNSSQNTTGLGPTFGLYKSVSSSGTSSGDKVDSSTAGGPVSYCRFYAGDLSYVRRDIAYIPNTDAYGNRLTGPYEPPVNTSQIHYVFTSGTYNGKLRPDNRWAVVLASTNAVDNQATTIRSDANLRPVIYCIGLAGNSDNMAEDPDWVLLKRVANANDPQNTIYDPTIPAGLMVEAPTLSELNLAFARVASEILRLAQ